MIYQYSNYHTFHVDLLSPYMSAGTKTYSGCCRTQMRIVLVYSEHRGIPQGRSPAEAPPLQTLSPIDPKCPQCVKHKTIQRQLSESQTKN